MKRSTVRRLVRGVACTMVAVSVAVLAACPAYAADPATERLNTILGNATHWLMGILAAIATFFLTVGAVRHVTAGGDPGEIEKAKAAYKSAATGYVLAALAPLVVQILMGILGIG
jgi:hypothetical protein